ncbi:vanadium-dependent haloperoxidase [Bacillus luteolus]|uniref:Vanadium-dependent haloperoxidase n=1 Tax=Litchfieldia luteola TaxID=682179 RepID=A0ABR9QLQ5_9BACI|nr:vanadium-dependent haloperoxidase [Cytobacillus luteolus]MBE4909431.1 vanadium-dependent haloperoxidase [Cytobacillus luteolus]MBP1940831.1 hypothetical protein [Cytobacillus luteolus]
MDLLKKWNEIPYAGEQVPPTNPEEPSAGSWVTHYIKTNEIGEFFYKNGKKIQLDIRNPSTIDWKPQLAIVKKTLENLTPHQMEVAKYWGTGVPTKQFVPIMDRLIDTYKVPAPRAARILAAVLAAVNDAFVVTWKCKFDWQVARPNQLDQSLETILCTPRHPTYPSGHATIAGCVEQVLGYFFPGEAKKLRKMSEECSDSRLYAGVHFPLDNSEGLRLGRQIGRIVVEELKKDKNEENRKIDKPYRENRNAVINPPPYEQVIPYEFANNCTSLLTNNKKDDLPTNNTTKPTLFY